MFGWAYSTMTRSFFGAPRPKSAPEASTSSTTRRAYSEVVKYKIEITLHCFDATDPGYAPDLCLNLFGDFLGALRHRKFFIVRRLLRFSLPARASFAAV